jgi:hypothetical protein
LLLEPVRRIVSVLAHLLAVDDIVVFPDAAGDVILYLIIIIIISYAARNS